QDRRAPDRRVLHRQGPARSRLQAWRDGEVREGHRAQVHRAADQGLDRQAAARVRSEDLAIRGKCEARSEFASAVRRIAGVAAVALALSAAAGTAFAKDPPKRVVKDPHFGDTLFYFYQTRYFTSVTNLMVSQHFERMPNHTDDAEILRGGLFLSYGLHKEAG